VTQRACSPTCKPTSSLRAGIPARSFTVNAHTCQAISGSLKTHKPSEKSRVNVLKNQGEKKNKKKNISELKLLSAFKGRKMI